MDYTVLFYILVLTIIPLSQLNRVTIYAMEARARRNNAFNAKELVKRYMTAN